MDLLKWHAHGGLRWSAWSTLDGAFTAHEFRIERTGTGWTLQRRNLRGMQDVDLVLDLRHREFTLDDVQRTAEWLRLEVPTYTGEPLLTLDEVRAVAAATTRPDATPRCRFVHEFLPGAQDRDVCQCGSITKGLARRAS